MEVLSFFDCSFRLVHPAVSVEGGAVLKVNLASAEQDLHFPLPRGADCIILARGMV